METTKTNQERYAGPGNRQTSNQHGVSRPGHFLSQPAHLGHVVRMHGVNYRARTQEQKALEESMRDQVHPAGQPCPQPQGGHHVAQLTNRRIGQDTLDVGGRNRDGRCHK